MLLLWIESRLFRNSRAQSLDCEEIALARHRNMILYSRAEFLTHRHENFTLTVASAHIRFGEMAVQMTSQLAGLDTPAPPPDPQTAPRLAELPGQEPNSLLFELVAAFPRLHPQTHQPGINNNWMFIK